jgi:hypothetical protein
VAWLDAAFAVAQVEEAMKSISVGSRIALSRRHLLKRER